VDEPVELPSFSGSVHCGQDVFLLGRDDHMNLRITHGRVDDQNPGSNERHHCMLFFHQKISQQRNDDYLCHTKKVDYLVRSCCLILTLWFANCNSICYFVVVSCNCCHIFVTIAV
jgi:hypothetical protein